MNKPATLVELIEDYLDSHAQKWTDEMRLRANAAENLLAAALTETPQLGATYDRVLYRVSGYGVLDVIELPREAAEIDRQAAEAVDPYPSSP